MNAIMNAFFVFLFSMELSHHQCIPLPLTLWQWKLMDLL